MPIVFDPKIPVMLAAAHPELDRDEATDHWWMHAASVDGIHSKIAEGYRLFRLKANTDGSNLFSALFVRNETFYKKTGGGWLPDLTEAELKIKAADPAVRILSIAPRVVSGVARFSIVFISNNGSQHRDYTILTNAADMKAVQQAALSFGGRIVDIDTYQVKPPFQIGGPLPVLKTFYTAVITKNEVLLPVTQWVGTDSLEKIGILLAQKNWKEKVPVRLLAMEPTGNETFAYVMETCAADQFNWYYDGITVTTLSDPDDLIHICRRLAARPVDLRMNPYNKRYTVCLISNGNIPVQGKGSAAYNALDEAVTKAMRTFGIAGGTLGLMRNGQLVYAKGFGYTDIPAARQSTPETLIRIASVSKPITALAVLRMIQDGLKLPNTNTLFSLDTRVFGDIFSVSTGTAEQKKVNQITVRHLMEHSAGLCDALAWATTPEQVLDTNIAKPLDFTPGTSSNYRNSDYHLLGLVIKKVAGKNYGDYVAQKLLQPLNINRMAFTGSLPAGKGLTESVYYDCSGSFNRIGDWNKMNERRSGGDAGSWVATPEERRPASTWAASPIDLLRLMASVEGTKAGVRVLDATRFNLIAHGSTWSANVFASNNPGGFYGLGFNVNKHNDPTYDLDHNGYLPGSTNALLRRRSDGFTYCWIINGDSSLRFEADANKPTPGLQPIVPEMPNVMGYIDNLVNTALNQLAMPLPAEADLFPQYGL